MQLFVLFDQKNRGISKMLQNASKCAQNVCMSVCMSAYMSVYLSVRERSDLFTGKKVTHDQFRLLGNLKRDQKTGEKTCGNAFWPHFQDRKRLVCNRFFFYRCFPTPPKSGFFQLVSDFLRPGPEKWPKNENFFTSLKPLRNTF